MIKRHAQCDSICPPKYAAEAHLVQAWFLEVMVFHLVFGVEFPQPPPSLCPEPQLRHESGRGGALPVLVPSDLSLGWDGRQ